MQCNGKKPKDFIFKRERDLDVFIHHNGKSLFTQRDNHDGLNCA